MRNAFEAVALQSSQRLPGLLFYTKKSYRILQLQFYKGTHTPSIHIHPTHMHPENSPSRIQFYMQKTKSSSSTTTTTTTYRGQRDLHSRNSTHRRQGDLLEIYLCVLQDIPGIPATRPSKGIPDIPVFPDIPDLPVFPDFPVIHDIPASPGNSTKVPVSPGNPPHYSILQLECIFYSSIGFHRKLHRVPVEQLQTFYKHYILQRKGDVVISVNFVLVKMSR